MQWFEGKIPDAIQLSKQKGSLFIVYIYGKDDLSDQMNSTWDDEAVSNCVQGSGAVAIKFENTSEECKFFSQIYPVVVVPSTFCIGAGGIPLEVIGGHVNPDEFVNKLNQVIQIHAAQIESVANNPASTIPINPSTEPTSNTEPAPSSSSSSSASVGASGDTPVAAVPLEEKVQKAKELLEKTKEEKAKQEFEKNRENEIKRRKLGHDLAKLKKNQQEAELKEIQDQLKKDREEERKAKEKIRQQIARDREERQVRFNKEKQERDKVTEEKKKEKLLQQQQQAAAEEARRSETARIQVRLPDGSSISQSFPSSDTFSSLQNFVTQKTGQNWMLSTTYPKRKFTDEDMSRTFVDLELAPSAVLIALPAGSQGRQSSSSSSEVQTGGIISLILAPFLFLWSWLYSLLFGSRNSGSGGESSAQESQSSEPDTTTATKRQDRPTTAYQRRRGDASGRVRRLHDMRDDDDDMSTYNGNSTQQL